MLLFRKKNTLIDVKKEHLLLWQAPRWKWARCLSCWRSLMLSLLGSREFEKEEEDDDEKNGTTACNLARENCRVLARARDPFSKQ